MAGVLRYQELCALYFEFIKGLKRGDKFYMFFYTKIEYHPERKQIYDRPFLEFCEVEVVENVSSNQEIATLLGEVCIYTKPFSALEVTGVRLNLQQSRFILSAYAPHRSKKPKPKFLRNVFVFKTYPTEWLNLQSVSRLRKLYTEKNDEFEKPFYYDFMNEEEKSNPYTSYSAMREHLIKTNYANDVQELIDKFQKMRGLQSYNVLLSAEKWTNLDSIQCFVLGFTPYETVPKTAPLLGLFRARFLFDRSNERSIRLGGDIAYSINFENEDCKLEFRREEMVIKENGAPTHVNGTIQGAVYSCWVSYIVPMPLDLEQDAQRIVDKWNRIARNIDSVVSFESPTLRTDQLPKNEKASLSDADIDSMLTGYDHMVENAVQMWSRQEPKTFSNQFAETASKRHRDN